MLQLSTDFPSGVFVLSRSVGQKNEERVRRATCLNERNNWKSRRTDVSMCTVDEMCTEVAERSGD